jgi:hypothetical protein
MARLVVSLLVVVLGGCSSEEGTHDASLDRAAATEAGSETSTPRAEQPPRSDGPRTDAPKAGDASSTPGGLGAICTQQSKSCGAGLKCVFLDAWNAPKGTCVRALPNTCTSWDDPRCVVAGSNYSVMCGPYTENTTTTHICFLLCKLNGKAYDCPPQHTCKLVKGYDVCLPL